MVRVMLGMERSRRQVHAFLYSFRLSCSGSPELCCPVHAGQPSQNPDPFPGPELSMVVLKEKSRDSHSADRFRTLWLPRDGSLDELLQHILVRSHHRTKDDQHGNTDQRGNTRRTSRPSGFHSKRQHEIPHMAPISEAPGSSVACVD